LAPGVAVGSDREEYVFETDDGKKTLAELPRGSYFVFKNDY
jgi:predicted dithiol-disulfide oxidoreductase (DUF899 family)